MSAIQPIENQYDDDLNTNLWHVDHGLGVPMEFTRLRRVRARDSFLCSNDTCKTRTFDSNFAAGGMKKRYDTGKSGLSSGIPSGEPEVSVFFHFFNHFHFSGKNNMATKHQLSAGVEFVSTNQDNPMISQVAEYAKTQIIDYKSEF